MSDRFAVKKNSGFSLIELMMVVAIMAIIAAFALPSLMSSKRAANEAAAISYLKSWVPTQELYRNRFGVYADADNQLFDAGLISVKGEADSHGYVFGIDSPSSSLHRWWGRAYPIDPGVTGTRWFFVDESGVIRHSTSGTADSTSPPL